MGTIFGIDYGSKLSGNTVIAIYQEPNIFFMEVEAKVDADQFIRNAVAHFEPELVFIDAPLSLPGVYRHLSGFQDYHFRKADRDTQAMSPMFLGGLAARAIELKSELESSKVKVLETYPKLMAQRFDLKTLGYKGSKTALKDCIAKVRSCMRPSIQVKSTDIKSWHHLDALLALMSALSYHCGDYRCFGDEREGLIYI
ncbi:DUF429 domain-containing protein [Croceimicrobium sp.]|uniref:DUF429 domain-containing protein n=1 Tax=Croceimicrobium sp. TaxID=2828340 RepID=UPI003BA9D307